MNLKKTTRILSLLAIIASGQSQAMSRFAKISKIPARSSLALRTAFKQSFFATNSKPKLNKSNLNIMAVRQKQNKYQQGNQYPRYTSNSLFFAFCVGAGALGLKNFYNIMEMPEDLNDAIFRHHKIGIRYYIEKDKQAINQNNGKEFTPLNCAILWNNLEAFKTLIDAGADINAIDKINNRSPLNFALVLNKLDFAQELLKRKVDFKSVDKNGDTVLKIFMRDKSGKTTKLLLEYGADVESAHPTNKSTALMRAITFGNVAAIKLLLGHKANIFAKTSDGKTALDIAKNLYTTRKGSFFETLNGESKEQIEKLFQHCSSCATASASELQEIITLLENEHKKHGIACAPQFEE